jgi:signal peptidase I
MADRLRAGLRALAEPLLILAIMVISTSAIAQPFYVPSGSMEPTLAIGDYLVATKYSYGYSRYSLPFDFGPASRQRLFAHMPARGDVVVFRVPGNPKVNYVKRVIGLPGDRVQMRGGHLILNGRAVPLAPDGEGVVEFGNGRGLTTARFRETLPGGRVHTIYKMRWDGPLDDTVEYRVPSGHYFMMGDNRDDSLDSRVPVDEGGVGFVPDENLVGRARLVVASYDFLNMGWPARWLTALRPRRALTQIE